MLISDSSGCQTIPQTKWPNTSLFVKRITTLNRLFTRAAITLYTEHLRRSYCLFFVNTIVCSMHPGKKIKKANILVPLCNIHCLYPILFQDSLLTSVFSPLAGGFLTGKVTLTTNSTSLHDTGWKGHSAVTTYTKLFDKPAMHSAIRILEAACKASDRQLSLQEAALRWIVHHSALRDDNGIILGATRIEQLESNVADIRRGKLDARVYWRL